MTSFITMSGSVEGAGVIAISLFILFFLSGTIYIVNWLVNRDTDHIKPKTNLRGTQSQPSRKKNINVQQNKKKNLHIKSNHISEVKQNFEHPHLLSNLKGHSGQLTGGEFSSNGKYFITSSEDRSVFIWMVKEFPIRGRKSIRINIEFDHAQRICWSPDSKAFLIFKAGENAIEVYKINKTQDGTLGNIRKSFTFPKLSYESDVIAFGMPINGKFIMTCDVKNQLTIWDLKGSVLDKTDTRHGDTYSATISPCGRFIVTTGFTPEAKVWEVKFNKKGNFECIKRLLALKGHNAGIYNCGISCDSSKMVTVSKDGTWRLYNTKVEDDDDPEPALIMSAEYEICDAKPFISISPDGRTIALASGPHLWTFSAITGQLLYSIKNIYIDNIKEVKFDPNNVYILTLGENHVRIFHNVAGYETTIQDLQRSKAKAKTNGMRERINVQIAEAKSALNKIEKGISN